MGEYCSWMLGFLLPSLWETEVAAAAVLATAVLLLLFLDQTASTTSASSTTSVVHRDGGGRSSTKEKKAVSEIRDTGKKIAHLPADSSNTRGGTTTTYVIKLELLSAKYLIGANLSGTSDPYSVISCGGNQKRFSSMVPSARNPVWGEEFNFLVRELPVEVTITIYDWDSVCKCKVIGSVTVAVLGEDKTGATWYDLDSKSGQVCLRVCSNKVLPTSDSFFDQCTGVEFHRKVILNKHRLTMTEDSGPLQAIPKIPYDEVVHQIYSCALERSFLHYGRMYISSWYLCFHSKVLSKQLNVIIPLRDIDEIKKSQHSLINPAITIFIRTDTSDHGAPPICSKNGRIRYKFTSFWNRNRTFQAVEMALRSYQATLEAEKHVRTHSLLQRESMNVISRRTSNINTEEQNIERVITFQPFINEHVLIDVTSNTFPDTPEKFFNIILGDNSIFFQQYRNARKDTDLKLSKWCVSNEYGGYVREVTFRSLCNSPLCPPNTAVTEWQRASFSNEKRNLIYETKQQAHDVPFGSYFEIHSRWSLRINSSSSCRVDIKIGVNMKKWCILQSKIKSGATDEYRREVCKILQAACDYILKAESNGSASDDTVETSSVRKSGV